MKYPIGTRVKVTSATDGTTDTRFMGKVGVVTGHNANGQTGNTEGDPLHDVEFDTSHFDKGQPIPASFCEEAATFDSKLEAATLKEEFWHEELTPEPV